MLVRPLCVSTCCTTSSRKCWVWWAPSSTQQSGEGKAQHEANDAEFDQDSNGVTTGLSLTTIITPFIYSFSLVTYLCHSLHSLFLNFSLVTLLISHCSFYTLLAHITYIPHPGAACNNLFSYLATNCIIFLNTNLDTLYHITRMCTYFHSS